MRQVAFSFSENVLTPATPQYAGVQGEHNATEVLFTLPQAWIDAGYAVRAELVDGVGAFDTSGFLARTGNTVSVPLPLAWTAAGGLAEIRLAAAELGATGMPERMVAYSPVGYLYFESRDGEPVAFRDMPGRGLSAMIADGLSASAAARNAAAELKGMAESGAFDGEPGPQGEKGEKGDPGVVVEKEWTLIEDITLTEVVNSVSRNLSEQDYKEVWIEGTLLVQNTTSETCPAQLRIGRSSSDSNVLLIAGGLEPGETTLYMRARGYVAPSKRQIYEANLSRYRDADGAVYRNAGTLSPKEREKIDVVYLDCFLTTNHGNDSRGMFAAGTNIKIWGR